MPTLDTTRAKEFPINIWDYNNLPIIATFTNNGAALNLTNYGIDFILKKQDRIIETYTIDAGDLVTDFLSKMGAGVNVLYMQSMFEDIRDKMIMGNQYRLLMKVTNPAGDSYIYTTHRIYGRQH